MNIKLFRKRQGITQEKLAELMEVHENTILKLLILRD